MTITKVSEKLEDLFQEDNTKSQIQPAERHMFVNETGGTASIIFRNPHSAT